MFLFINTNPTQKKKKIYLKSLILPNLQPQNFQLENTYFKFIIMQMVLCYLKYYVLKGGGIKMKLSKVKTGKTIFFVLKTREKKLPLLLPH